MKKGGLENFAKFTGKHLWFAKFSKIFKNSFFTEHLSTTASGFVTEMGYYQQCLENLR